jgi:hypothetical protein
MAFVSARFVKLVEPDGSFTTDQHIAATDENGRVWQHSVDCQVGDWLRYLEAGGEIAPYVEGNPE